MWQAELGREDVRSAAGPGHSEATGSSDDSVSFRAAAAEDMPAIRWMVLSEFMNPLSLARERFVVAEGGGGGRQGLLGVGQVKEWPGEPPLRELRSLVVKREHRGRGVGTRLLRHLLARFEGQGPIYILTISRSIPFYQRAGFKEVTGERVPQQLRAELFLGGFVARLAAQDRCLCMVYSIDGA